jgi:hypothetical protein
VRSSGILWAGKLAKRLAKNWQGGSAGGCWCRHGRGEIGGGGGQLVEEENNSDKIQQPSPGRWGIKIIRLLLIIIIK